MSKRRYLNFLILLVLGLIVYSNAFDSPFVYDDKWFIVENANIRYLSNFLDLSGTRYITLLSFALNYAIGAYEPFGYNLTNIIIHIINSMLVYSLASLMLKTPVMAGERRTFKALPIISALIFLTHPIETQAVNYVTQRFAILATLFYLISLTCYMRSRLSVVSTGGGGKENGSRYLFYAIALIAAVVAQKTKEISFTLPFVICLFEFSFFNSDGRGGTLKRRILSLLPFVLTMVIIPATLYLPEASHGAGLGVADSLKFYQLKDIDVVSRFDYLITQFRVIVTYLRLLFLPYKQNLLYDYPFYRTFLAPVVIASFVFLASIVSASLYLYIRSIRRGFGPGLIVSLGILWFFITISIESSIIPIKHVIFEHRLYLPSVGFFIAVVAALLFLFRFVVERYGPGRAEFARKLAWVAVVSVVLFLAFLSFKRNIVWTSELRLWRDVVLKNPDNFSAHNNLGLAHYSAGDEANARKHFHEAIRIKPGASKPLNNLGYLYFINQDNKNALIYYKEALRFDYDNGEAHNNIANVYKRLGDRKSAIFHYEEAAKLMPFSDEIIFNMAVLYMTAGNMDKAKEGYVEAIRLDPGRGDYHLALAVLYRDIEEFARAIIHFKEAIKLSPELEDAHISLASIYFSKGSYGEAVLYFKSALVLNPENGDTHYNLATTYREMDKVALAKKHYQEAIRIKPDSADAHLYLATIYLNENRPKEAERELREALRIKPGYKEAAAELNQLLKSHD